MTKVAGTLGFPTKTDQDCKIKGCTLQLIVLDSRQHVVVAAVTVAEVVVVRSAAAVAGTCRETPPRPSLGGKLQFQAWCPN